MKLSMLVKQLRRLSKFGITNAELRLGFDGEWKEMGIDVAVKEIEEWIRRSGAKVASGEIIVKPFLPRCWDSNAR